MPESASDKIFRRAGPAGTKLGNDPRNDGGDRGPRDGNGGPDRDFRGSNGGGDRDTEALVRCAVEVLGDVPEIVAALTDEKKQLISDACFR